MTKTMEFLCHHAEMDNGFTLDDILVMSDFALSQSPDLLKLVFPLPGEPAALSDSEVRYFRQESDAQRMIVLGLERFSRFLGFEIVDGEFKRSSRFEFVSHKIWKARDNIFYHLIERAIRCLRIVGLEVLAEEFYDACVEAAQQYGCAKRDIYASWYTAKNVSLQQTEVPW